MAAEEPGAAPDGGWGWCIVLATFISTALSAGNFYSFGVMFAAFLDAFGESKSATAWVGSIFGLTFVIGSTFSQALTHKIGHRLAVMIAGTLATAGLLLSSFGTALYQLYFTFGILAGFGLGMGYIPCVDLMGKYFKKKLSLAIGFGMAGTGAGHFTLSLLNQLMVDAYGWRGMLLILSAMSANMCVVGALLRPIELHKRLTAKEGARSTEHQYSTGTRVHDQEFTANDKLAIRENGVTVSDCNHSKHTEKITKKRTRICNRGRTCVTSFCSTTFDRDLLTSPVYILHIFLGVGQAIGHSIVSAHVVRRLRDFGVADTQSSLVVSLMGLAQLTARPLCGAIANSGRVKPYVLYGVVMATCGATTLFSIYVKSFAAQVFYIIAFGMCLGSYIILIPINVSYFHGKEKIGHGMALLILVHGIATLTISPIAGHMRDIYGNYDAAFWVVVIAYLFSSIAAFSLPVVDRLVKKRRERNTYRLAQTSPESDESEVFEVSEFTSTV